MRLTELGVFEVVALCPVYLGTGLCKVEVHELGKGMLQDVFPGAVVLVMGRGWRDHGFDGSGNTRSSRPGCRSRSTGRPTEQLC